MGIRYFNKYVPQHKNEVFSIKYWLYTDVNKPTTLDLTKMLNNENFKVKKTQGSFRKSEEILLVSCCNFF